MREDEAAAIHIYLFCVLLWLTGLALMSAARRAQDGGLFFFFLLSTHGDCHQFASWHLNQAFQTGVFEMQMW